jgi:hypothetical protein
MIYVIVKTEEFQRNVWSEPYSAARVYGLNRCCIYTCAYCKGSAPIHSGKPVHTAFFGFRAVSTFGIYIIPPSEKRHKQVTTFKPLISPGFYHKSYNAILTQKIPSLDGKVLSRDGIFWVKNRLITGFPGISHHAFPFFNS